MKSASYFFALGAAKAGLNGAAYDKLATEGYAQCVVAFACINKLAAAAASAELHLYRKSKSGKLAKVENHDLLDLLSNPNPAQSGTEFFRHLVCYHQLAGNAYVYGNGIDANQFKPKPPRELQLLNPGKVEVLKGETFLPAGYKYRPNASGAAIIYPVNELTGRSAVLQLKTFNPLNSWYGLSPIDAAALGIDIHNAGSQWNKRLIENGARPSGALVMKQADGTTGTLSEDQYIRLKEMIDQQFSGQANAGRPLLLEGGLDWKEMSLNPKDMDFLEGKHSAARDVALAFGVPPMLLGIPGDATYSNLESATMSLWTDTVIPLLVTILEGMNRWLTPLYGDDLYLWFDEEGIPALEPRRKAKADRINAANYLTLDEKRAAMGYDAYKPTGTPGGTILVSSSNIPLELAGEMPDLAEPGSPADEEDDS